MQEHLWDIDWSTFKILALAIPLFILFTRLGAWLRRLTVRLTGNCRFWTVTVYACGYFILAALLALPFDFFAGIVQPHISGDPTPAFLNWLKDEIVPMIVRVVVFALFIWIPYLIIAKSPRRWWLYCTVAILPIAFLAMVAWPVWVDPLTTSYKPLNDPALQARIDALAVRCGIPHIPVLVGGHSDTVTGIGPTNRIVLRGDIATAETPDGIVFTVGHEMKHYLMNDAWKGLGILAFCLLTGFWLTDRIGRAAIRRYSKRWGFTEVSDPASLPLMIFLMTFLWLLFTPCFNLIGRHIEHEADRFGLELTHQNRGAALDFANDVQKGYVPPEWDHFFLIFMATHPSVADRIHFANTYKPWETGQPLKYSSVCKAE